MLNILSYQFGGPFHEASTNFNEVACVYVILDSFRDKLYYIDVGETDKLKTRLATHERRECWERNSNGDIYVAVYREDNTDRRLRIEREIREAFKFPCGEE